METQVQYSHDPCPKGIVNQLLDIAKENDAMSEIGGATGWRWQEGIISRMPKTKTVARILKKAYGTDDPQLWHSKVNGDLQRFVKNAFSLKGHAVSTFEPKNVFEAIIFLSIADNRGATEEELINRLCLLKYASSLTEEEQSIEFCKTSLVELHKDWAKKQIQTLTEYLDIKEDGSGFYKIEPSLVNSSDSLIRYQLDISKLQNKIAGNNSYFDLWRYYSIALSDDEMIEVERKMIAFYETLVGDVTKLRKRSFREQESMKTRLFSLSAISLSANFEEDLK